MIISLLIWYSRVLLLTILGFKGKKSSTDEQLQSTSILYLSNFYVNDEIRYSVNFRIARVPHSSAKYALQCGRATDKIN